MLLFLLKTAFGVRWGEGGTSGPLHLPQALCNSRTAGKCHAAAAPPGWVTSAELRLLAYQLTRRVPEGPKLAPWAAGAVPAVVLQPRACNGAGEVARSDLKG